MSRNTRQKTRGLLHPAVLMFISLGIAFNVLISMVVRSTSLPFYIDTVGTIIVTAIGGTVPGLFTAFFTNAINFILDGDSVFYAPISMLIAVWTALFFSDYSNYRREKLRTKVGQNLYWRLNVIEVGGFILVIALMGGLIGGEVTWYLYETPSELPLMVSTSTWITQHMGLSVWGCHMLATFLMDVIDKGISVVISLFVIHYFPPKWKQAVEMNLWRQSPLSYEEQRQVDKRRVSRFSLGFRMNLIIILSTIATTAVVTAFSLTSYRKNIMEWMSDSASQVAYLAAEEIDPSKVGSFLEDGGDSPEYIKTKLKLIEIKNSSKNVVFLYVYQMKADGCHVIFDLDSTLSDGTAVNGDKPGQVVPYEMAYEPYKNDLLAGKMVPPTLMEDEYGSFLAAYYPVYDKDGSCVCYAISNIESSRIQEAIRNFFGKVLLLFTGFFILIITISVLTIKYHIVMPIAGMTVYANRLADAKNGISEASLIKIEKLDIRTKDEMELLYKAFVKMTGDMVAQYNDIESKSEAISKMQTGLIITMADMVESRDSDTGAHVLKTSAYVRIILQGLKKNGYYAEKLTDAYMREVEMSAPLHDVGKINISDTILNKPGKLTEEEYEIMKTHTTAGKEILDNAIQTMEGDNYLKEARNMAAYHHERWDGKGYPEGLHGEVIPLSARIMAVADVFDALSSPRVYKPALSLEESIKIIEEGSGTQFDPKCVEVFLEALPEIKKVLKKYQEK